MFFLLPPWAAAVIAAHSFRRIRLMEDRQTSNLYVPVQFWYLAPVSGSLPDDVSVAKVLTEKDNAR